jgi:hypothetical protein
MTFVAFSVVTKGWKVKTSEVAVTKPLIPVEFPEFSDLLEKGA